MRKKLMDNRVMQLEVGSIYRLGSVWRLLHENVATLCKLEVRNVYALCSTLGILSPLHFSCFLLTPICNNQADIY